MQSSPAILLAVVCGFFLIIAAMVAFVVYTSRKENERYTHISQALGFSPLENTDELFQKIAFLRDLKMNGNHRLTQVYYRTHSSGARTYMYNLSFRSHSRSASGSGRKTSYYPLETNALAFVSPTWKLPLFSALPRLTGSGVMKKMGNTLAEKGMDIKHEIIKFPHIPNLDERYLISIPDGSSSVTRPSDDFLRVFAAYPNLQLYAGGDTLTLSYTSDNSQTSDEEKMKALYKLE